MPGPKIPSPRRDSAASTIAIAWSIVGVWVPKPAVNWENKVEPMPMMTASTSTLTPLEMTLPSTRSAMNADLPNRPHGISTKPATVIRLNSLSVTKSSTATMQEASKTSAQENSKQANRGKDEKQEINNRTRAR